MNHLHTGSDPIDTSINYTDTILRIDQNHTIPYRSSYSNYNYMYIEVNDTFAHTRKYYRNRIYSCFNFLSIHHVYAIYFNIILIFVFFRCMKFSLHDVLHDSYRYNIV